MYGCLVGQNNPSPVRTLGNVLHLDFVHVQDATHKHACAPVQLACHAIRVCMKAHEIASFFSFPCFFSLVA